MVEMVEGEVSLNRYAKRRDANESEIVEALEKVGATVERLDTPADLLVGWHGPRHLHRRNYLIEVKMPGARLTRAQERFHEAWRGQICVVHNVYEALCVIGEEWPRRNRTAPPDGRRPGERR